MFSSTCEVQPRSEHHHHYGVIADTDDSLKWLQSSIADIAEYLHLPATPQMHCSHALFQHRQYKTGQSIFALGAAFNSIALINSGFTRSTMLDENGNAQVVNFQMKGEILGVDGIHGGKHNSEIIALSECDLILLPLAKLAVLGKTYSQFGQAILNIISTELVHQQSRLCILAARNSEVRVASFLLDLSSRYHHLGYSKSSFNLRMSRNDLGSYLGLTLETVSRTLSVFNESGMIEVRNRDIRILDYAALHNLAAHKKNVLRSAVPVDLTAQNACIGFGNEQTVVRAALKLNTD